MCDGPCSGTPPREGSSRSFRPGRSLCIVERMRLELGRPQAAAAVAASKMQQHILAAACSRRLRIRYVNTHDKMADKMADFFTKPLHCKHFFRMRDEIMNVSAQDSAHAVPDYSAAGRAAHASI